MNNVYRRRAESLFALLEARKELHQAIKAVPDYTGLWSHPVHLEWSDEDYYRDEKAAHNAAIAEYGAAHAPTADEIKDYLTEHLGAVVKVIGDQVSVEVGLEWLGEGDRVEFGHVEDSDSGEWS